MSRLSYLTRLEHKADPNRVRRTVLPVISAISRLAGAPVIAIRTAADSLTRWRERRSTVKVLSDLDDRLLRDIGLYRGDIGSAVDRLIDESHAQRFEKRRERQSARNGTPVPMGCG